MKRQVVTRTNYEPFLKGTEYSKTAGSIPDGIVPAVFYSVVNPSLTVLQQDHHRLGVILS